MSSRRGVGRATTLEQEFDATAARYDVMVALNPGYHEHLRTAARELCMRITPGRVPHLADLGCGSGASTAALIAALNATSGAGAAAEADVLGVDASDGMLASARRKVWPAGVRFRHGIAEDISRRAAEWGIGQPLHAVLACYLFRNVDDRDGALRAVFDVLEPGGWLVVQDYSVAGSRRSAALWTAVCWTVVIPLSLVLTRRTVLYRYLWRSVLRFDSVEEFEARLRTAGFESVSSSTVGGWQAGILHTFLARRPSP